MTLLGRERGRLRFEEVDEGLGQRRAGAVAMSDEIERPRDLQIRHLHAVEQPGEALVHDRALGNEGDPNAGPDSLLDGLGRAHLSDHAEGGEVAADIGQGALHGFAGAGDRKSTRLNSSHTVISYAVFCLKKKRSVTPYLPDEVIARPTR